jgi:ABC-type multidrug transport system fused ATPase/permease subunit
MLLQGRTILINAHRLNPLQQLDHGVVMAQGNIAEV